MKRFFVFLIVLFVIQGFVFSADLIVGKNLDIYPKSEDWLIEKDYLFDFANWKISNTTSRDIYLNEVTLKLFGSGDDTKMLPMIYPDLDEDGQLDPYLYGASIVSSDNATIVISFDENVLIPANNYKYFMVIYSKIQDTTFTDGDTFQNYLTKLKGNFVDDGTQTISVSPGNGFLSSKATVLNRPTYFIEVTSSEEYMMLSGGDEYLDGGMIKGGVLQEEDFAFRVYSDCNLSVNNEFIFSGATKLSNSTPLGQSFKMYSPENITSIALNMRSTYATEDDTVKVRIRKDSIGGEIIKETTLFVEGIQYNSWFLFNFENTCEASCGNNILDEGEVCDGDYLDGKVCKDIEGYYMGALTCNNCLINTSECLDMEGYLEYYCVYNHDEGKEKDCNTLNTPFKTGYVQGKYSFNNDCEIDLSECKTMIDPINEPVEPICGNGTKETGEACDKTDFGNKDCTDFDFDKGTLQCTNDCTISVAACYNEQNNNEDPNPQEPAPDQNQPETEEPINTDQNQEGTLTETNLAQDYNRNLNQTINTQGTQEPAFPIIETIIILLIALGIVGGTYFYLQKKKVETKPKNTKKTKK